MYNNDLKKHLISDDDDNNVNDDDNDNGDDDNDNDGDDDDLALINQLSIQTYSTGLL